MGSHLRISSTHGRWHKAAQASIMELTSYYPLVRGPSLKARVKVIMVIKVKVKVICICYDSAYSTCQINIDLHLKKVECTFE